MTTNWNPALVSDELLRLSRRLGEPGLDLAILGEGNTSEVSSTGRIVVKASGARLADVEVDNFVDVDVAELVELIEERDTTQAALTAALDAGTHEGVRRRASIETLVHASVRAFSSHRFVAHTHPTPVIALLASVHSEDAWDAAAYSDEAVVVGDPLWVPYAPPGIELGRIFHEALRTRVEKTGIVPSLVLLGNHGIVAISDTVEGAEAISLMAAKGARIRLAAYAAGGFRGIDHEHVAEYWTREDFAERRTRLAGTST